MYCLMHPPHTLALQAQCSCLSAFLSHRCLAARAHDHQAPWNWILVAVTAQTRLRQPNCCWAVLQHSVQLLHVMSVCDCTPWLPA